MSTVRILLAVMTCLLLAGCSSDAQEEQAQPEPSDPPSSSSPPPPATTSMDPCDLMSTAELELLVDSEVSAAKPGLTSGVANCQWEADNGQFVQVVAISASDWAMSLPETMRALEASDLMPDGEALTKLREGNALIAAGKDLAPARICSLFSQLAELQGAPPGSPLVITIIPSEEAPQAVSGQMCSGGHFTSVLVGSVDGLSEPLPTAEVFSALETVHRRVLG